MSLITSPHDSALNELCQKLAALGPNLEAPQAWPAPQLELCARAGVFAWYVPREYGWQEWNTADLLRAYMALGRACLTTAFVLTQWAGGCRRVAIAANRALLPELLPQLAAGNHFTTIAISHLTTSRRHLAAPVMQAQETSGGFILHGYSPWVTGAQFAHTIVVGATLADGRQILASLPTRSPGVTTPAAPALVALNASHTGELRCERVFVAAERVLHGPVRNVMSMGAGAGTGGLQTSALALGLTFAALEFLERETQQRAELAPAAESLEREAQTLFADLLAVAEGNSCGTPDDLRARANSLVLRATQAALVAAKGTGYLAHSAAGRWCREALFFLVWSCPQGVLATNLCELAGIE